MALITLYALTLTNVVPALALGSSSSQSASTFTYYNAVRPVLECVERISSTSYVARFGYQNDNSATINISVGNNNKFSPSPQGRGQTTSFLPGRKVNAFQVPFNGSSLVWSIKGPDNQTRTATASSSSALCPAPTPTPTPSPTPSPSPSPSPTPTPVCAPGRFNFVGNSSNMGPLGNIRTFTATGGNQVRASAFSRVKATGVWETSYLVSNVNGLGVSNRNETAPNANPRLDNIGQRVDYILLEFSNPIIADKVRLQGIGNDKDASFWIGSRTNPFSNHLALLTDSILTGFGQEDNDGTQVARVADINASSEVGNILVIAARPNGTNDEFKATFLDFLCQSGPVNTPPDAVNDSATVLEDSSANVINVLANDTDANGNPLTITAVTQPANGTVAISGSNVTYTPNANFFGTISFTYTISDGQGGTDTATVNVTVTGVNDAPVAVNNAFSTNEDTVLNVAPPGVLGNDLDADGNALTAALVTTTANGTLALNANGSFSFTPAANFSGTTSFTYRANDGLASSNIATVTITVNGVNDAPDAVNDAVTVAEDSAATVINVRANDTDPESNTLTITAVTQPANGTVVINAGTNVSFTPNANFNGTTSFTYTISDGNGGTDTATVTVTVTSVNDGPDAVNDSATVARNSSANAINVLANDTDVDGDTLSVTAATNGTNGTVTFTSTGVSYTPNANYFGTDSFTYTISDGNGGTDTATVNVTVTGANDAPDAVNDSATVAEDSSANAINVLANDTDADGGTLSITAATNGANGSVTFTATGVTYSPNANFNGSDSFTYTISDGQGGTDTATVNVTVSGVNDAPDAVNDAATVAGNSSANAIAVLANDSDIDGDVLTITAATNGANGTVTFTGTVVSYTPNNGFSGSDSFTYTISDGNGGTDTATVNVTVEPIANPAGQLLLNELEIDPPSAISNSCQYAEIRGANADGTVPANTYFLSVNSDGANFGFANQAINFGGQVVGANGTITLYNNASSNCPNRVYGPGTTFVSYGSPLTIGTGSETYLVVSSTTTLFNGQDLDLNDDGILDANLGITVLDGTALIVNPEEEYVYGAEVGVVNISNTISLDQPDAITRFIGDTTPFAGSAFYYGELSETPDETNMYAAPKSANFPAGGQLTPGNQNALGAVNTAPDAVNDSATVAEDSVGNAINVLANDTDADGDTLTITAATNGTNGTVTFTATGVSYTPNANFVGSDSFTYTISDGNGGTDTATVSVNVGGVNDAPDAVNDSASVTEDSSANAINVLANDTDGDGDTLVVTAATNGTNGTVTFTATGVSYTPNANFNGSDSFTYTISDGNGGTDTATVSVTVTAVNDAPDAVNDSATVAEDSSNNPINVLVNDTDVDGDTLVITAATNGTNGTVTFTATGVTYTPAANFVGSDSFTYTISDGNGGIDTATVSVTVGGTNDAPVAVNDAATVAEDSGATAINVLANDTDGDGDTLTVTAATNGANGTVTFTATGVSYTPNANFNGTDSFTYTISDGNGGTASATVSVTVTAVNDAPDAVNDSASVTEDSLNNAINVLANDTDVDGNTLSVTAATNGANGTVTFTATGVSYTPNANFNGSDSFTYTISDGNGGTDTATVSVTVGGANDAPDAVNDSATVVEDSSANAINVLANDTDGDGDTLVVTAATNGANGTVTFTATGVSYTPNANFSGSDSFTYTISDGNGGTDTATVRVTVTGVNDAPDAVNDSATVAEDSSNNPINVLVNDTDVDGNTLSVTAVTQGANGTVTFTATGVSYSPAANFVGSDSFTYTISDGNGGTDTATVSVTVGGTNDAPVAVNDSATVAEDSGATAISVLANDTDADGDTLSVTAVTQGANGSVTFTATGVSYTPNANFNGTDSFTYTISDGNGGTASATVNVTVTSVNDAPDAVNDSATVAEDSSANAINVLANDTDVDGNTLSVTAATNGANGTVTFTATGVTYTPNANFSGSDSFTYTISDGNGGTDTATVSVTVTAVNDAPDAVNDSATVAEDSGANAINVLANDTDGDGNTLSVTAATNGANGTVTFTATGVSYTPNANFNGSDSFTYTISDGNGGTDTATVNVTVTAGNDAPDAVNDSATVVEDSSANAINVLANDTDADGNTLSVTAATNGANGTVTFTATGVSYAPNANFSGSDSFTYTISDGNGGTDTATVNVTVTSVNDAPDAVNDSATVAGNSSANAINVLANDTDVEGNTLVVTAATNGANGTVTFTATGVSYTPNNGFSGSDSFTYTISDGNGGTDTATVNVTVEPIVNPAGQLLLNELEIDPPSAISNSCQYAEIRGANAGGTVPANTYFLSVNSDGANFGFANQAINFGGQVVGANGTITLFNNATLGCPTRTYGAGTTFFSYSSPLTIGVGSETYLVVSSTTTLFSGQDLDTDDDGLLDPILGITILDGTALIVNPEEEYVYGAEVGVVNISNTISLDQPDAITRFIGDTSPFFGTAFYFGELAASPDSTTSYVAPLSPNFPAGGQLTPGDQNTLGVVPNSPPDAVNDSATVAEDSGASVINVLANDTDPNGDALTVTAVTQPANGTVTFTATGVSYTPNANFNGSNSFTYTISDGNGGTDTATVAVTVSSVNDAPDAVNDSATVNQGTSNNAINVLGNDTDIDGNVITITAATNGTNGTVTFTATGVSYTPNASFSGSDSFTYTISDGNGGTDTATVSVTVTPVATGAGQLLLNELEIDPPSAISNACQYAEIRGANAGGTVPANTYFLSVNSDGANFGFANQAINFGGQVVGANGTITLFNNASLGCPTRTYGVGTTFFSYFSPLTIGVGSETYLVVSSTTNLFSGQDLDTDDDGLLDANLGITILDGAALIVNPEEEFVYGAEVGVVNISNTISLDQPDAITRSSFNSVAFDSNAFFFGELAASPDSTTTYAAPLSPNFPVGGVLTPGAPNVP